jgi:hypothetical protein
MKAISSNYSLSYLRKKRALVAGEIVILRNQLAAQEQALVHLDAALVILDPTCNPPAITPRKPQRRVRLLKYGQLSRMLTKMLREATAPLSTAAIAAALMKHGGCPDKSRKAMDSRVKASLQYLAKHRRIAKVGHGRGAKWMITPKFSANQWSLETSNCLEFPADRMQR